MKCVSGSFIDWCVVCEARTHIDEGARERVLLSFSLSLSLSLSGSRLECVGHIRPFAASSALVIALLNESTRLLISS